MAILDDLSGYDFEDVMVDVFRRLGYENVRQSARTADEGRDVLMEELLEDGTRRAVVVECKHTDTVSRPVVQKLHSAVATYDYDGPVRGIVATSGRFTGPAREYAERVGTHCDGGVDLLDGRDHRDLSEENGLDLYNGRIEVLCTETLEPTHPLEGPEAPLLEAADAVDHLPLETELSSSGVETACALEPTVTVTARTRATFETSVGVIHRVDERDAVVIDGTGVPSMAPDSARRLLGADRHRRVDLEGATDGFDERTRGRFGRTESEYADWAVERLRRHHTTTVGYTGDNNVDYEKTCAPTSSDVMVEAVDAVYVPHVTATCRLGSYRYVYAYHAGGPTIEVSRNDFDTCVHCAGAGEKTYCPNCGSINCPDHTRTERLEGTPVCPGCAVTERFALKRKYFYDEANLEDFRERYASMAIHEKAMENPAGVAVGVVLVLALTLALASGLGVW